MAFLFIDGEEEVSRTIRDEPPTHFSLKIKSFSNSLLEKYESNNFEAGGHKWKLCLYPKGNKDRNGEGHISLYLEILEPDSSFQGWEVHALFRFFLLDQLRDKYLSLQGWKTATHDLDANGKARRFRATKTQSGFDRFISLKEFNDPSKGYLVNDTCEFGAEVFVHKETVSGKRQCLLMTPGPVTCNYTWKIEKFSELVKECHSSEVFTAGGHNWYPISAYSTIYTLHTKGCIWRLKLWPNGIAEEKGKSLSLVLMLEDPQWLLHSRGVYAEAHLQVMDQVSGKHMKRKMENWFNHSKNDWGWRKFLSLSSFRDELNGYLVKDVCIIEAHLLHIGSTEKITPKSD